MRGLLEFNLSDPDEQRSHIRATKATDAYLVISDMFQELRKDWKYSEDDKVVELAEKYRDELVRLCEYHGINLDTEL